MHAHVLLIDRARRWLVTCGLALCGLTHSSSEWLQCRGRRLQLVRAKPSNLEKAIRSDAIDPDTLPPWRGIPTERYGPLATAFFSSFPVGAHFALHKGKPDSTFTPPVQFLYSLWHIVASWEGQGSQGSQVPCWRHVLEFAATGDTVTIDILRAPLECPEGLAPLIRLVQGAGYAAAAPLLLVRYLVATRDPTRSSVPNPVARLDASEPQRCSVAAAASHAADNKGNNGHNFVKAASSPELAAAVAVLEANEKLLSEAYTARFYAQSAHHRPEPGFFRCSFLFPPTEQMLAGPKPSSICAGCGKRAEGTSYKWCERCKLECYCSKECQASHWKVHKKACGRGGSEQQPDASHEGSARLSLILDLTHTPVGMEGKVRMVISDSGHESTTKLDSKKAPRNIHGSEEFLVKVQATQAALQGVPGSRKRFEAEAQSIGSVPVSSSRSECMVYDEARSFNTVFECTLPGSERLLQLIDKRGSHVPGRGAKGYFLARREGASLRIFTDNILPQPAW